MTTSTGPEYQIAMTVTPAHSVDAPLLKQILEDGAHAYTLEDIQNATGRTFTAPLVTERVMKIIGFSAIGVALIITGHVDDLIWLFLASILLL